jgi:NitT/TauT family transport system substrate-binding protein
MLRDMSERRHFLGSVCALTGLAATPWLAGCGRAQSLRIATNPWVGYETLYLARDLKWLPNGVELLDLKTASNAYKAMQDGQANAACLTLDEMLKGRALGLPLSVAMVFDSSAGGDMALARPGINSPKALAGKRIGFEKSAVGNLVFEKLLEATGLPASALTVLDLPPDQQLAAWRKNAVDVVITFEPFATMLVREGAQRLFDSRQMPEMIFDVLAVHRDQAADLSLIQSLVACHFRALDHLHTNPDDAHYRIAGRLGLTPDEVRLALGGLSRPTLAANRSYLIGSDTYLIRAARAISSLMVKHGLLVHEDNLDHLILPGTLPRDEGLNL